MLLTALILVAFAVVALLGVRYSSVANDGFLSRDYTTVLKGLCCVVIVFVHVPVEHGNALQDLVGSFGYVCVTLFFMFSGFGLKWSVEHKSAYLQHFLKNRILILMIPYVIIFVVAAAGRVSRGAADFVLVLLFFYIAFYLSHRFLRRWRYAPDAVIYAVVVAYSLTGALTHIGIPWYTEALGFAYGIALVSLAGAFSKAVNRHYAGWVVTLSAASVALGFLYLRYKSVWFTGDYVLRLLLGAALILLLLSVTTRVRIGNASSRYLGKISYEVFLVHELAMAAIGLTGVVVSSGMYILSAFALTFVAAAGLNRLDDVIAGRLRALG